MDQELEAKAEEIGRALAALARAEGEHVLDGWWENMDTELADAVEPHLRGWWI